LHNSSAAAGPDAGSPWNGEAYVPAKHQLNKHWCLPEAIKSIDAEGQQLDGEAVVSINPAAPAASKLAAMAAPRRNPCSAVGPRRDASAHGVPGAIHTSLSADQPLAAFAQSRVQPPPPTLRVA